MRKLPLVLLSIISPFIFFHTLQAIDSKGAIIIANLEGQVTVKNNDTGVPLSADRVKVGGMIFDGHTVETGKGSKVVLLFSSGTITTLKEESVLNIKKFAQQKFDPKSAGKLSARKDEPSPSETVIDLSLGDMVVDVKKLKKESSFNIDSPVGTAGIRGTIPRMKVIKLPDGTINQTTQMLKGQIAFMPKGGGRPTLLGPGQSLAFGINAAGMSLPIQIGRVPAAVMKAIQAEVDQASAATGKAVEAPPVDAPDANPDEDAPSEDELNEADDERQASSKGVGDDENGTDAVALEKAGLLDLENPEDAAKANTYVEVAGTAAEMLDQKKAERRAGRRSSDSDKDETTFVSDLVSNFGNVVDVTEESESLGLKDSSKIAAFAESSDQSGDLLAILGDADEIGAKNSENMDAVFSNPDKATNLKKVIDVAKDAFASDRRSSDGAEAVTEDGQDTMKAMFRTADKANEVAAVVASAETAKSTDADKGEKKVLGVFKVVKSVDKAEQDKKAAEEAAAQAAAEAAAKKAAEEEAALRAAQALEEAKAAGNAEAIAAAEAAAATAAKKKAAVDDYSAKLTAIKNATDSSTVDTLLADFTNAHDAEIVSILVADGLDLSGKATIRITAIKAEASAAQKENVFGNLETVSDLAVASIEVEEQAAAEAAAAEAKKLASSDYQIKLAEIEAAGSITDIEALVEAFDAAHTEANRQGLDLSALAAAHKEILSASASEREAKLAAAASAKAEAEARAQAKAAAAERAKAAAEAKAADTGFDSMIENADQATELKKMVDKSAEIEAAAAAKQAATADYQAKLAAIESADSVIAIDLLVSEFNEAHLPEYISGLDLTALANAHREILNADESERAAKQAAATAAKATADAAALAAKAEADAAAENKADLGSLLKNADKAKDLAKVIEAAESLSSGDSSTLTALLKNPEQAQKLAEVVDSSTTGGGEGEGDAVTDSGKLNVLFSVVKSSDAKKVAAQKQSDAAEAAGAYVPAETEELILATADKSVLKLWKTGKIGEQDFSEDETTLNLLNTLIDNRIEEINSQNVFAKIDTVVEVAKSVQDNGGGSNLDSILDNAEKADDLKVLVDSAITSGGSDGSAGLLTNVLDNAEKATELSEVVSSAADEGVDVTKLLENAKDADSLLKAKKIGDQVAAQAEQDARAAIEAAGGGLTEQEIAEQVEVAKKAAKKEVMESVATNAENAEDIATVLDSAAGADADTMAALMRNADQAVSMAQTINESLALEEAAADTDLPQDLLDSIRLASNVRAIDELLANYQETLPAGDPLPDVLQELAAGRKKSLSLIKVVKQVDDNKQVAKAIAEGASSAAVSQEFRDSVASKTSASDLKQLLLDNLPASITDDDLKAKVYKAKTVAKVRELLAGYDDADITLAVDHWSIVYPRKEELNAALAFQSIDTLADVASKTTASTQDIELDDGLSQDVQDQIAAAQVALDDAETLEDVDAVLQSLVDASIDVPAGLTSLAESRKESINLLTAVLENAGQAAQVAVLLDSGDSDGEGGLLDSLGSGGEDFDFEAALSTGALGSLKTDRFKNLGLTFKEFYAVDESSQISLKSDISSLSDVEEAYLSDAQSILGASGETVYSLSAEQVNALTGEESGGLAGVYRFSEEIDAETESPTGVVLLPASKKIGVEEESSFAVDPERAGDILFILDSPAIKADDTANDEVKEGKANLRAAFISNSDQLDNLLELNKVIGDDQAKIEVAFENLSLADDLVAVSQRLRYDQEKLDQVYADLGDSEVDQDSKSLKLSFYRSLSDKFHQAPEKLDAVFANSDKLEALDDLTDRLDINLEGSFEDKGQINLLFSNLDFYEDFLTIVNRFEGEKRDAVLKDIRSLVTSNPTRKALIFANPSQASSLKKLYDEFKYEPSRVEVIFEFAAKAEAFLDVLNDLRATGGGIQLLFNDPEGTMADIGFTKLISEYPEKYHAIFEENKEISAELSSTASKFKSNPEYLDLVFANIDKLEEINGFANEFGSLNTVPVLNQDGEVVIDEQTGEEKTQEVFVFSDPLLTSIFFKNIDDLSNLFSFKEVGEIVGIPGGDALRIFDKDPGWLFFVLGENGIERDEDDRPLLNDEQKAAARFLGDLYLTDVPVTEVPLELARELFALGLSKEELGRVITDLLDGPLLDGPDSAPPGEDDPGANADLQTLSFLLDHSFTGSIDPSLIISAEIAMASSFFKESLDVYDEISMLGESMDEYVPQDDGGIIDSGTDGSFTASQTNDSVDNTHDHTDTTNDPNSDQTHQDFDDSRDPEGVLGGKSLSFGEGTYDLSLLAYDRLLFAASENLSISGSLIFEANQDTDAFNQLLLMSAGGISLASGSSITYEGNSLGLGSFNTLRVIDVDLFARDEISLRSLDRLVIKNTKLTTSGRGFHDAVELLAHQEISVDNLIFSEHIKRVAMEAMTVNLSNLNFPSGSQVKLNSAYGGIDGKYPNFNSMLYGRVNFIQNIRYANNPVMSRPDFDLHGGNISIGRIGN